MSCRGRLHRLTDESGQSLVMALLVLTFLAITLGGVIFFTAGNQRNSNIQKSAQVASSLAEAGVNNAIAILADPANRNYLETGTLLPNSESAAISAGDTKTGATAYQAGTTVTWWGTLDQTQAKPTWTLTGKATVPNPTGAAPIVKQMQAQVAVNAPKPGNLQLGVWNSIYSPYGPSAGCDTTVAQGVVMSVPLYVGGNLCLQNKAKIQAPTWVGGFFQVSNTASNNTDGIGTSSTPVTCRAAGCAGANPVHIGGYCQANGKTAVNPCKAEPTNPDTNVWLSMNGTWDPHVLQANMPDFASVTAPPICWATSECPGGTNSPPGGWYTFSSPGPLHPCTTTSGTVPVFDNDQQWGPDEGMANGSVAGSFNLTPATPYTCKTGQGELSWNPTTRVLTVYGTIFIDGNVTATTTGNQPITYSGGTWSTCTTTVPCDGVIYVTGTVYITSEMLCAQLNSQGNNCDWTNWDPNKKILIFLAHGQGSQSGVGAGQGIVVGPSQTSFQGGLYAKNQVVTGQGAATQGPLVSGTQTVVTGQQFQGSFPAIDILPISIQGPPQLFYISPPQNFCYGKNCDS